MERETIERVVDGVRRKIVAEVDNGESRVEFSEDGKLQMIIDIPEDVINLEKAKFKRRKYAYIFDYFLYRGIGDLLCERVAGTISTNYIECKVEFVFYNKNNIEFTKEYYNTSYSARHEIEINHVRFRYIKRYCEGTYRELNELKKDNSWELSIANTPYRNKHNEDCVKIWVDDIPYTMLKSVYDRLTNDDYLRSRNFFKKGSTLFNITREQNKQLARNNILKREENFIKYIDFDGSVIV